MCNVFIDKIVYLHEQAISLSDMTESIHTTQGFLLLYDEYITPIYRFVYFRVPSVQIAEDLVSRIFLKAFEKRHTFRSTDKGTAKAWIYTIARHTIIDWQRTRKETTTLSAAFDIPDLAEHADPHVTRELMQALSQLTDDQQDVLRLRFWHDLSYKDIATVLGKSPGSCRVLASRAVNTLKDILPKELVLTLLIIPQL